MVLPVRTMLERNELFRGLPTAAIQKISLLAIRRSYGVGAIVFAQGDPGEGFYGVITGRIRISASTADGKELFLNLMKPGDTFGEIALLDGNSRTATASSTAPSEADDNQARSFPCFVATRAHAGNPSAAASVSAHSLDKRLGGRLRIAYSAGASGAATIGSGQTARARDKKRCSADYFAAGNGALPGNFPASRQPASSKLESKGLGRSGPRQDNYRR